MAANGTTTLPAAAGRIKTIVVLIQENRSFDHMLGWMKSLNPAIDGADGTQTNPTSTADPSSPLVPFGDGSVYVVPDPGHSIQAIYEQIYGEPFVAGSTPITPAAPPDMKGFLQEARREGGEGLPEAVMNGFRPVRVPVYMDLVREFAVCDRWFASVPASTQPNRLYVHSATSHGLTGNDRKMLVDGLPQRTIFDSLHDAGLDFGIYYEYPPATLFYKNLRKLKYSSKFHMFDLEFKKHCKEGKLANYVVIEQRYFDVKLLPGNDDHPSHDVGEGQKLVKEVYEALRSSPQWDEILFIITYDEHGGFYDHVPTPVGIPSPDDVTGPDPFRFEFDRLGVRVPAILISPWIEKGTVLHRPSGPYPSSEFEHSSIPATVKKVFGLKEFLTKRDAWAGTFDTVLTRSTPRTDCPSQLSDPVKLRTEEEEEGRDHERLSEFQSELVEMAAVLNGDCTKGAFLDNLMADMTVAEGAQYTKDAFKTFMDACDSFRKMGVDESEIVIVKYKQKSSEEITIEEIEEEITEERMDEKEDAKKKSLVHKLLGCFRCDQH